jgi:hypothetical protein
MPRTFFMSYQQIREAYKKKYSKTLQSSWIAHVLSEHGKTTRKSPQRKGDYKFPCPDRVRPNLEKILKDLKII